MKAGTTCIIRTPKFKAKAKELNISEGALARIAFGYQNQEEGKPFPSDSYVTEIYKVKNYVDSDELDDAVRVWKELYSKDIVGSWEYIDGLSIDAQECFDYRAVAIKPLNDGQFQLIINKPEVGEYKEETTTTTKKTIRKYVDSTEPKTEEERFKVNQSALGSQISFEPSTHVYTINGKQADYSVTEFRDMILGKEKPQRTMLLEVASRLGTTYDTIARDYFADTLQKSYPNISSEDLQTIKDGLGTLRRKLNKAWPGATIITDEKLLRVAGIITYQEQQYSVAGTMDMVVIDKDGIVHVLDFKTHRANKDTEFSDETKFSYAAQLSIYRELLKAQGYKVADAGGIAQFNLQYENPSNIQYQLSSNSNELQVQVLLNGELVNIQDAIAQAGIGAKKVYKGASFHALLGLSVNMEEINISKISPIITPKYLRQQTAKVAKQTEVSSKTQVRTARTLAKETPVKFRGSYHLLSNMADKPFTIKGNDGKERTFKSVEQYYHWAKAITAEKYSLANKILTIKSPYQIHKIGEEMGMTDKQEKEWNRKKRAVMKKAMKAAFEQNDSAMKSLVNSKLTFTAENEEPFFVELLMELREEFGGVKAPVKESIKTTESKKTVDTSKTSDSEGQSGIEIHKGYWTRAEVEQATDKVFLFGDNTNDRLNTHYIPNTTQAVIRGLPNAIGIDTKKNRNTSEESYFTDKDFEQFKAQVDDAIQSAINSGKTIVLPEDGIGTGKAELEKRAPKLYAYLQEKLQSLQTSGGTKAEALEDVEARIRLNEEYRAEAPQVPSTEVKFEGELVDLETVTTEGSIYTAEYNMLLKRILNLRVSVEGETQISYDITNGSFDNQIAKLLTSLPISCLVRIGAEQGVPNPNVLYLMEMMISMGYNPIYSTRESDVQFEKGSISDIYAANLKNLNYNKKTHTLKLPVAFTYGKTNEEIKKAIQRDILFNSPLFTPRQLRTVSKGVMYQLSHMISQIQGNVNGYEIIMGEPADVDYTKMSRIDIIKKIGLTNLLDRVKERVFGEATMDEDEPDTMERKFLIYDNWQAILDLGYDTVINLEEISITTKSNNTEGIKTEIDDMVEGDDEQIMQELFGSSIEHWQVGFRQVSAFSSLSQSIKRFMDKLYVLDNEGNQLLDEYGLAEHINAQEAVSKILAWTQGAQSLDDKYEDGTYRSNSMLAMLKSKLDQAPWLEQIIEALEGKKNEDGSLAKLPDEEFRAQFYSNFAKYFQKYSITFKDNAGKVLVKVINEDSYSDIALGESQAKENGYALGYFKLRNNDGSINKSNLAKLIKLNKHLQKLIQDVATKGKLADVVDLDDLHNTIKNAIDLLDITLPEDTLLWETFGTKEAIKNLAHKINFLVEGGSNFEGVAHSKEIADNNKSITTLKDYSNVVKLIVANMGTDMESVSYEAGKMYYSYVIPSYLGRLVTKLRKDYMSDTEYQEFIEDEYLSYEWFQKTKPRIVEDSEGNFIRIERVREGAPRCYWLQKLTAKGKAGEEARANLEHVVSLHAFGEEYTDKTPASYIASMVKMFLYDNNHRWAYYRVPIQSNKPSEDYIKFERIHDDYENVILKQLVNVLNQELDRIQAVKEREDERKHNRDNGLQEKAYDKYGDRFAYLDWLNKYRKGTKEYNNFNSTFTEEERKFSELLSEHIDGLGLSEEGNAYGEFISLFQEVTKNHIEAQYEDAKKQWIDEGFITLDKNGRIAPKAYGDMKITESELKEFYWNDMFAAINIFELTVTDIAYFKTTEELQKRLAQLHAPGMRAHISAKDSKGRRFTDGKHRVMTIADDVIKSDIIPNLRKAFDTILTNTTDAQEKARLETQFKDILDSLEEVNFADAQGYTTPTAYRKKMGIFGKWRSMIDEPAYEALMKLRRGEKLAEGEKLSDYINVLWQPLKPFIYTQIFKNGYATMDPETATMPNFKEGRQIKDSEFCLVLAAALTQAGGQKGILNAIFDFMEDTLTTDGEPNGEGIDTIVFESTQKAVKPYVLNLNGKSYDEAKQELEKYVYRTEDGHIYYDEDYVDEMSFNDYAIQQEIPVHFIGHKQAQGSQDRILAWADIRTRKADGTPNILTIGGKQVSVEAARTNYFNAVANNIELSTKALIKRFNLEAVDIRLKNIALSRVLQDAILKDSRFGADLLWACDTNKYGEFNIPLSDPIQATRIQQLLNSIIKNEINKQEIEGGPVVQVSSWGRSKKLHIRYQTEDKFDNNGNLIEAGKILLSKEEFDGTEELPRGYATKFKSKDGYDTYKDYIADQHRTAYYEASIPIQNYSIAQDFMDENGVVDIEAMEAINPKLLEAIGYRIPTEAKYSMVPIRIVEFTDINSGEGAMLPAEITWQSGSDFDIDKLYLMLYTFNRVKKGNKYVYEMPEEGTKGYNNNIIVETQLAILCSDLVTEQFYTPGNFEEPKKYGYQISYVQQQAIEREMSAENIIKLYNQTSTWSNSKLKDANITPKNLIFNQTQVQFHKQNMTAAKLIGIFAQANVSHAFISLRDEERDCFLSIPKESEFILNGIRIANANNETGFLIDRIEAFDGTRISSHLASLLAASVDAVKDPILNLININKETANFVTSMLRMGFSLKTISLLCSQPIIRQLIKKYNLRNEDKYTSLNTIIEEMEAMMPEDVQDIETITVSNESLIANLSGANKVTNYMVLEIFKRMQDINTAFRDITHMTRYNSITSAVGPTAVDTAMAKMQDEDFYQNNMLSEGIRRACDNPTLKAFRESPKYMAQEILGKNMIQAQPFMYELLTKLKRALGRDSLSGDIANKLADFVMSFYVQYFGETFDLSYEHRKYMLEQFPADFNAIKSKYRDNAFISSIQFVKSTREEFPFLRLKTRGLSSDALENYKQAWAEAYLNNETRDLAIRLVEYGFFRGSFGFSPKTFISQTPNIIKVNLKGYISSLNNGVAGFLNANDVLAHRIINQFILHNTKLISGYYGSIDKYEYEQLEDGSIVIDKTPKEDGKLSNILQYKQPFIHLGKDIYYVLTEDEDASTLTIQKVDALGGDGQGFEISTRDDFPKTVYSQKSKSDYTSRSHTTRVNSRINEETIGVLMSSLFEDEELESLGSAMQIRDAINKRLMTNCNFKLPSSSMKLIMKVTNKIKQSILKETMSASEIKELINAANKTIDDLNLCN